MTMNSSDVVAGDIVYAAEWNQHRLDILTHAGDTISDAGSADAYDVTVDESIVSLVFGQVVKFVATTANTGASTLRFHNSTVDTTANIKRQDGSDLLRGDIFTGGLHTAVYDGTNFVLQGLVPVAKFGGDGSDGSLDTSGGAVAIDLGSADVVVKNYTSINVATNDLTFTNPGTNGTIVILKSQGDVTISSTIDLVGIGAEGGAAATPSGSASDGSDGEPGLNVNDASYGKAGLLGNGSGVTGRALSVDGGDAHTYVSAYTDSLLRLAEKSIKIVTGSGGGSGGTAGSPSGAGGRGGGGLYIECAGALDFSGTIDVSGDDGETPADHTAAGAGGGGGGAAGSAVVLYNTLTANTGTVSAAGGAGGDGSTYSSGGTSTNPGGGGSGAGHSDAGGYGGGNATGSPGSAGQAGGVGSGGGGGLGGYGAGGFAGGAAGSDATTLVTENTEFV